MFWGTVAGLGKSGPNLALEIGLAVKQGSADALGGRLGVEGGVVRTV